MPNGVNSLSAEQRVFLAYCPDAGRVGADEGKSLAEAGSGWRWCQRRQVEVVIRKKPEKHCCRAPGTWAVAASCAALTPQRVRAAPVQQVGGISGHASRRDDPRGGWQGILRLCLNSLACTPAIWPCALHNMLKCRKSCVGKKPKHSHARWTGGSGGWWGRRTRPAGSGSRQRPAHAVRARKAFKAL